MLIVSNLNPYKKLLENIDREQEQYLVSLLEAIVITYKKLYEEVSSEDNISYTYDQSLVESTNFFQIKKVPFNNQYEDIINSILEKFPELEKRQKNDSSFIPSILTSLEKDQFFSEIEKNSITLDGDLQIGFIEPYLVSNLYINENTDIHLLEYQEHDDKYIKYYTGSSIELNKLISNLDYLYVVNNYEEVIDKYISAYNTKILNEINCRDDILTSIELPNKSIDILDIEFSSMERQDYPVYIDKNVFMEHFETYARANNILGIRSDDNTVWEEE